MHRPLCFILLLLGLTALRAEFASGWDRYDDSPARRDEMLVNKARVPNLPPDQPMTRFVLKRDDAGWTVYTLAGEPPRLTVGEPLRVKTIDSGVIRFDMGQAEYVLSGGPAGPIGSLVIDQPDFQYRVQIPLKAVPLDQPPAPLE